MSLIPIRPAELHDVAAITRIYAHAVLHGKLPPRAILTLLAEAVPIEGQRRQAALPTCLLDISSLEHFGRCTFPGMRR